MRKITEGAEGFTDKKTAPQNFWGAMVFIQRRRAAEQSDGRA